MALFPRKINGHYANDLAPGRREHLIMFSDQHPFLDRAETCCSHPRSRGNSSKWATAAHRLKPKAGWLVLSHGVGAMRKYCIGAFLLDRDDPTKVIGRLREPLLSPNASRTRRLRPNVVYTCGALLHGRELVIPYAMSDSDHQLRHPCRLTKCWPRWSEPRRANFHDAFSALNSC